MVEVMVIIGISTKEKAECIFASWVTNDNSNNQHIYINLYFVYNYINERSIQI